MPQWNHKQGAGTKKKQFGEALKRAKKKHPVIGSNHRNFKANNLKRFG